MSSNTRRLLIYFSLIFDGDWLLIFEALQKRKKELLTDDYEKIAAEYEKSVITILDDDYPKGLLNGFHPPFVLYYIGDKSLLKDENKNLAVIGSRKYSKYGETITRKLVSEVAKDYVIVSGLAMGVDGMAHEEALNNGGRTIAVLGSGIDVCYPLDNKKLYNRIAEKDLIISEFPPKTPSNPANFPKRNRIIAGIAKAILVTEAYEKSGTSITVSWALSYGKDVMCVPYPYESQSFCNHLIKEGAYLTENKQDIVDVMGK